MISSSGPLTRWAPFSPWYQATTAATKKPTPRKIRSPCTTPGGQPHHWPRTSATSTTSQAPAR